MVSGYAAVQHFLEVDCLCDHVEDAGVAVEAAPNGATVGLFAGGRSVARTPDSR